MTTTRVTHGRPSAVLWAILLLVFVATSAPGAMVSARRSSGDPGTVVLVPVRLVLATGQRADRVAFDVQVTPSGGAPVLTQPISFAAAISPAPAVIRRTEKSPETLSVRWQGARNRFSVRQGPGSVLLGTLRIRMPRGAVPGQTYTVRLRNCRGWVAGRPVRMAADSPAAVGVRTVLSVSAEGEGSIRIGGVTYSLPCRVGFHPGQRVTAEAVPADGWVFSRWRGLGDADGSVATVQMDANKGVEAVFSEAPPTIEKSNEDGDGSAQDEDGIEPAYQPLQLEAIGDKTVTEGEWLVFSLRVLEGDPAAVSFSAANLPPGAAFDPGSATFSWKPAFGQAGSYEGVRFTATYGDEVLEESITIRVLAGIPPPEPPAEVLVSLRLLPIGDQRVVEGERLRFHVSVVVEVTVSGRRILGPDPRVPRVVLSAFSLPRGASFDPLTGLFSWEPRYGQAGDYYVWFDATCGSVSETQSVRIRVLRGNRPPVMARIGDRSTIVGQLVSFTVAATDPECDPLTYAASGLPAGAAFDSMTGRFSWVPGQSQVGSHSVHFRVSDRQHDDSQTVRITVRSGANRRPTLQSPGDRTVTVGESIRFRLQASDADGDALAYSASGVPPGASFDPFAAVFSWTPRADQAGSYGVTFNVSDGRGGSDSRTISIIVKARTEKEGRDKRTGHRGDKARPPRDEKRDHGGGGPDRKPDAELKDDAPRDGGERPGHDGRDGSGTNGGSKGTDGGDKGTPDHGSSGYDRASEPKREPPRGGDSGSGDRARPGTRGDERTRQEVAKPPKESRESDDVTKRQEAARQREEVKKREDALRDEQKRRDDDRAREEAKQREREQKQQEQVQQQRDEEKKREGDRKRDGDQKIEERKRDENRQREQQIKRDEQKKQEEDTKPKERT